MPIEISLPELGENVTEGDVLNVLVHVGDRVEKDQAILEVETGKATLEVPASAAGVVQELRVSRGDKVSVGQVLVILEGEAAPTAPATSPAAAASTAQAAAPAPAPSRTTGTAEAARPEAATATRSAALLAPTEQAGAGRDGAAAVRATASKGADGRIELDGLVPASPQVRRVARELGVDIGTIRGTGPNGRITIDDVKAAVRTAVQSGGGGGLPSGLSAALPDFAKHGNVRVEPMSQVRKATLQHIWRAWLNVPMVTQNDKADITALEEFRHAFAPRIEREGGKLTPTAILLKVCAMAIRKYPKFGCSIDPVRHEIIHKDYIHIGVAVDTPRGLLVPVLRDVDKKGLKELSLELGELSKRAREGKISAADLEGGCFSISNIGGIGGTFFSPIVNWPEVAILGVAKAEWEQRYLDGYFHPRLMMPLSLTYDHRIIDGADAARFLRFLAEALEEPLTMWL